MTVAKNRGWRKETGHAGDGRSGSGNEITLQADAEGELFSLETRETSISD